MSLAFVDLFPTMPQHHEEAQVRSLTYREKAVSKQSAHLFGLTAASPDDYDVCKCGIANPALLPIQHPAALHLSK